MAKGALSLAALLFVVCSVLAKSASSASIATECVLVSNYDEANGDPLQGQLFDLWNRNITLKGVMLVDWEGYMGNPEVLYRLAPPEGASFPVTAAITVDQLLKHISPDLATLLTVNHRRSSPPSSPNNSSSCWRRSLTRRYEGSHWRRWKATRTSNWPAIWV